MNINYTHDTNIHVLRACHYDDGLDLIAIGGDCGVSVLIMDDAQIRVIASFHIGSRVTALAWSPKSVSPSSSAEWLLELAVASADRDLFILTKTPLQAEYLFRFGGGLTGHHGKVNDMAFCGGRGDTSMRYVGSVSDDKMLMVWDLYPDTPTEEDNPGRRISRRQPTAYAIQFSNPLTSIDSHVSSDKEFLVADCRGSVFITDWRSDPENPGGLNFRHSNIAELFDPLTMISPNGFFGSAVWRPEDADVIGAAFSNRFTLWDVKSLRGGQPSRSGTSFPHGVNHFRWCRSHPELFAIGSMRPDEGANVHVYNLNQVNALPMTVHIAPKPHTLHAIDFMDFEGVPRIVAVVGRSLVISITMDKA